MIQKGFAVNFVLLGILVMAVVFGGIYFLRTSKSTPAPQQQMEIAAAYEVVIKENPADQKKSDIYLKDKNGQETFFITLDDVFRKHIHNSEYHNDNLYIIRRTSDEEELKKVTWTDELEPNWTDQLWKYDSNKHETLLYSSRGLDFRVSNDDKLIAVVGSDQNLNPILVFLDTNGEELVQFTTEDLEVEGIIDPLVWGRNSFWLIEKALPVPKSFLKIDVQTFRAAKYIVLDKTIGIEYVLNPETKKLAYSDYPPLFDEDSANEYQASGKKVTLYVYNLETDEKKIIDTSVTKKFNPKWVDESTIEYDNPKGEGRVTKKI